MRIIYRWFIVLAYLIFGFSLTLYYLEPVVERWIIRKVVQYVEDHSPFSIRIGNAAFMPGQSSIYINDIVLQTKETFYPQGESRDFIHIRMLFAKWDWLALLRRREWVFNEMALYITHLSVVRNQQGHVNLEYLFNKFNEPSTAPTRNRDKAAALVPFLIHRLLITIDFISVTDFQEGANAPTVHNKIQLRRLFHDISHPRQLVRPLLTDLSRCLSQIIFDTILKHTLHEQRFQHKWEGFPRKSRALLLPTYLPPPQMERWIRRRFSQIHLRAHFGTTIV